MHLKTELLSELSDLFVGDLRASQYYQQLSPEDRATLESRLARDAARGSRPLVPGALPEDIERTEQLAHDELGVDLPTELRDIFAEVDGFSENGVSLYGTDQDLPDEQTYGPTIIAENLSLWSAMPETAEKYLFIGDSDLWYFGFDLESSQFVVLSRSSLEPVHSFGSAAEMVNDMLRQALRISPDDDNGSPSVPSKTFNS
jgi:uncharacterized protein YneR